MLVKGIRVAAGSMEALSRAQDVTANNLANVNTPGFKKDMPLFHSFQTAMQEAVSRKKDSTSMPFVEEAAFDKSQGNLVPTENPFDLAITGEGYFSVETPQGKRYSRAGNFTLNERGELVTHEGYTVMGQGGPITLPPNKKVTFGDDGRIFADGMQVDRIQLVTCPPEQKMVKAGENLYMSESGDEVEASGSIRSGFLEQSTVGTVQEMVAMMETTRSYEAAQKIIRMQDDTLDKAVNSVGNI